MEDEDDDDDDDDDEQDDERPIRDEYAPTPLDIKPQVKKVLHSIRYYPFVSLLFQDHQIQ